MIDRLLWSQYHANTTSAPIDSHLNSLSTTFTMFLTWSAGIALFFTLSWSLPSVNAQGNTTCKGNTLDWYTSVVGETPCSTYQRLRQICNSAYAVGSLSPATPPDHCDDQVSSCCCNSISFALSMLCLNCQQGLGSGVNGDSGIDAGKGAYQQYLLKGDGITSCSPNTNKSLPHDIQQGVCNNKIKIEDDLYGLFWDTGEWFYEYTRETISKDQQTLSNNTFTHCASTTVTTTSSSLLPGTSSSSPANGSGSTGSSSPDSAGSVKSSSLSSGAIAGIVIGGVAILLLGILLAWYLRRRGRSSYEQNFHPGSLDGEIDEAAFRLSPFAPGPSQRDTSGPSFTTSLSYQHVAPTSYDPTISGYSQSSTPAPPISSRPSHLESRSTSEKSNMPLILSHDGDRTTSQTSASGLISERHEDGGPVPGLERSLSGRLPPAYGEQRS